MEDAGGSSAQAATQLARKLRQVRGSNANYLHGGVLDNQVLVLQPLRRSSSTYLTQHGVIGSQNIDGIIQQPAAHSLHMHMFRDMFSDAEHGEIDAVATRGVQ